MQSILGHEAVRIAGALDARHSPTGVTPRRLPRWASRQIMDPMFQSMVSQTSGVRLEFATDSRALELDVMLRTVEFPGDQRPDPCFDLEVDGEIVAGETTRSGGRWVVAPDTNPYEVTFRPGDPATIRFALPGGMHAVRVWLPQACVTELRDLRVDDGAALAAAPSPPVRWVHYGSSISHCTEADRPTGTWPAVAARIAGIDLVNLGFGGQCHLDQVVARTIRDLPVDVISLKLGINLVNGDTMRERVFVPALHGLLDTIRDGHPDAPILVVTPILYPAGEDHPGPSTSVDGVSAVVPRPEELAYGALSIGRIRELIAAVVERRRSDGDGRLSMLDGRQLFGEADLGDLPDGLHPNAAGYRRMGERFARLAFSEDGPLAMAH